jgi:leader peptidase (prepilin peptidase)/N-methyltransferase
MNCGYQLKWYDLIPVISYLLLKGKCRKCDEKISIQYPLIELFNAFLYVWIIHVHGLTTTSIIFCLVTSALIVLSIIDFRTYEIPVGINIFIGVLAIIRVISNRNSFLSYLIGFFLVSGFLLLIHLLTKGRGIGGGDIKLMAVSGLLLGYKEILLAFVLGCIIGSVIHIIRMKLSNEDKVLAFGPYLSIGIFITMIYGEQIIDWYLSYLKV